MDQIDPERIALANLVARGFERLGPNDPDAILADAALNYNSTSAHNARCMRAAGNYLSDALARADAAAAPPTFALRVDPNIELSALAEVLRANGFALRCNALGETVVELLSPGAFNLVRRRDLPALAS